MLSYEFLVSLFFRILDLCIITGLGAFLFFRWALPGIKQKMKQESDAWQQLHDDIQSYGERQTELKQLLKEDEATAQRLKRNIDTWSAVVSQEQKERISEREFIAERLNETYQQREVYIKEQALYKKVAPQTLYQAQEELKILFSDTQKADLFIADVLAALEKRNV